MPQRKRISLGLSLLVLLVAALTAVPIHGDKQSFPPPSVSLAMMLAGGFATYMVAGRAWGVTVLLLSIVAVLWTELSRSAAAPSGHVVPGFIFAASSVLSAAALTRAALRAWLGGSQSGEAINNRSTLTELRRFAALPPGALDRLCSQTPRSGRLR